MLVFLQCCEFDSKFVEICAFSLQIDYAWIGQQHLAEGRLKDARQLQRHVLTQCELRGQPQRYLDAGVRTKLKGKRGSTATSGGRKMSRGRRFRSVRPPLSAVGASRSAILLSTHIRFIHTLLVEEAEFDCIGHQNDRDELSGHRQKRERSAEPNSHSRV